MSTLRKKLLAKRIKEYNRYLSAYTQDNLPTNLVQRTITLRLRLVTGS